MIQNYEEKVYAGVLGKVIGVYMGRPVEGWGKEGIQAQFGTINRYVHQERNVPLVVPDDDITGTFTFVRILEDCGLFDKTPDHLYSENWLNYIVPDKTILWWGGVGISTEHTAFARLKKGITSPRSGSIELNGKTVAEQIGAQIFIDGFGMVAPGDPALAARLARKAAQVSHDGEAVNAAVVVAAMVAAAFVEKDIYKVMDLGVAQIDSKSLIAQIHREVRAWSEQDKDWEKTYERIKEKYGYDSYSGNCHVVPNHAIMVMAWAYAPDSFLRSQEIINTAGWDTDCNAANVGSVMGIVLGLDKINAEYPFQAPFADRVILPTAEGTRSVSDCLIEAFHIARAGRTIMGWPAQPAAKEGAWHHFSLPGALHGYLPEESTFETQGCARTTWVENQQRGGLQIGWQRLGNRRFARVSTPVLALPVSGGYGIMGTPQIYSGMTVTASGSVGAATGKAQLRLFVRGVRDGGGACDRICYGEPIELVAGKPWQVSIAVPQTNGHPFADLGLEITGGTSARGELIVDSVQKSGMGEITIGDSIPRNEKGEIVGWIADLDLNTFNPLGSKGYKGHFFAKNTDCGHLITGCSDWTDYTVKATLLVHCADRAGIIGRYQGIRRYVALITDKKSISLVKRLYDRDIVLATLDFDWELDREYDLSLTLNGQTLRATLPDGRILSGTDSDLQFGVAGFFIDSGNAGFRDFSITPI